MVYGSEHCKRYHKNGEQQEDDATGSRRMRYPYKPRYLKTRDLETGRMYALPNGLPGFGGRLKVHLIGHSMGALTARHFQYMLDCGRFKENCQHQLEVPKSDFVKSITSIAGAINGSLAPHNHGGKWCQQTRETKFNPWSKFITAFKVAIWG